MADLEARLVLVEARQEIAELVSGYSRAIDSRDRDGFSRLWGAKATYELGEPQVVNCGTGEILAAFDRTLASFASTLHVTTNLAVELGPADTASSISDVVAHVILADGTASRVAASYHDYYVREGGRWLFSRRVVVGRSLTGETPDAASAAAARDAIRTLCYRYTFALDEGDFVAVGALLSHGGLRPSMPGVVGELIEGAEGIAAFYDSQVVTYKNGDPRTRHLITNQVIDLGDGGRTASSHSYFTVLQRAPGHDYQIVVGGQYFDRFELLDGVWQFREKTIQVDHLNQIELHFKIDDTLRA